MMSEPQSTRDGFQRFRHAVLWAVICIAASTYVLLLIFDFAWWPLITGILAMAYFPGLSAIRLALGNYEDYVRADEPRPLGTSRPSIAPEWTGFTTLVVSAFFGFIALLFWYLLQSRFDVMFALVAAGSTSISVYVVWTWLRRKFARTPSNVDSRRDKG
jgi:uncharacterized membrane protein